MAIPKFPSVKQSFHVELKKRINDYFETSGKSVTGNKQLFIKAGVLFTAFLGLYIHLVFFTPSTLWAVLECVILGLVVAGIGFNIMHDGAHGSFSKYKWVNNVAAFSLNLLGGSSFMWNVKHNVIHHAYTNIDGVDDDIDIQPWMRMSSTQPKLKMHKYQHFYFWFLYSMLYILWVFVLDYQKYFKRKIGDMPLKKMTAWDHIVFWGFKAIYLFLFFLVPFYTVGFVPTIIGFLIFSVIAGFILSIVFQLAHTVEHTHFPVPHDESGKLDDEWAIHQLKTTANFAPKNKLISWLVGGLNYQIEHHLFPKISHVHYPAIRKIIKQACSEFNVPYTEYKKMSHAVISHVLFLKQMGRA
ncbi:fatty acid desaturase family protein [Flavisolibacter ginsengisoli]|jgi:linoleoyl-CoA desaturase|uniref:Linoleoyl-CoA desaturase n=1 Tax=Flavisolibacter ginsengisoli DSM 18119 TaxID=1121884 RepID=A0A1M4YZZ9_9BACT|nr:acyl-CoA desaturase [Flavisolibacter ginsengisoli]SHF11147.1 linoleoyl-CoA desaturase [Flavisolibacter ginsengisoli DSM 18119]